MRSDAMSPHGKVAPSFSLSCFLATESGSGREHRRRRVQRRGRRDELLREIRLDEIDTRARDDLLQRLVRARAIAAAAFVEADVEERLDVLRRALRRGDEILALQLARAE